MNNNPNTDAHTITPFQLAQLAVQMNPGNPEEVLVKARALFDAASALLTPAKEIGFLDAVESHIPSFCDGLQQKEYLETLLFVSREDSSDSCGDPNLNPFGNLVWDILQKRQVVAAGTTAPTSDDVRRRLVRLPKSETEYTPLVERYFVTEDRKRTEDWKVAFGVPGDYGKFKRGTYAIPVWVAYAVADIWHENSRVGE